MSETFQFTPGDTPLLISVPHCGVGIPPKISSRMTRSALLRPDTDWHVEKLYDFAPGLGAGLMTANLSRYVVDLNRDPHGQPLYPGADNSELVPLRTFASEPIYLQGEEPDDADIDSRRELYWRPYHACISAELERLHERFGVAVLWDAHSIASRVPRFFKGRLADLNLGSAGGASAAAPLIRQVFDLIQDSARFSSVLDGRFTGGYITRHYGQPELGVHALQLEMAEIAYMEEGYPYTYDPARAEPLRSLLRSVVGTLLEWAQERVRSV
jgi:N-formylglutamate amidohydrolase